MNQSKLNRYSYRLRTLSTLILSPRDHNGFYAAAGDFDENDISCSCISAQGQGKIPNIIYPFYQYGEYQRYCPETAQYYIPGSSIKGVLLSAERNKNVARVMVDDIRLNHANIHLRNLHKIQNLSTVEPDSTKQIKLGIFFPNVAVEMLDADVASQGALFCEGEFDVYLEQAQKDTKNKLRQLCDQIDSTQKRLCSEEAEAALKRLRDNLHRIIGMVPPRGQAHLLLGGYKGLLLSNICKSAASLGAGKQPRCATQDADIRSAIYLDCEKCLPHGLISLEIVKPD